MQLLASELLKDPLNRGRFFDSMPLELMQEIFLRCLPQPPPLDAELLYHSIDLQGGSSETAPLLLCQICKYWREAALSLPSLWSSLNTFVYGGESRPSLPLIHLWLQRSGALPLSLALYQQNESNNNQLAAGELLEVFKAHTSRWGNVQLNLAAPSYCKLLTSQQRSAPLLREFRLQIQGQGHQEEEEHLFGIFENVPQLSRLYVSKIPDLDLFGDSVLPLPWIQLHALSLDYVPSVATALHILKNCPNLMESTLKVDSINGPIPDVVCHRISMLNINIGHEQLPAFLEHVKLPGLNSLTIHVRGPLDQYGWPQIQLEQFLRRSESHLRRFEVHNTGMRCHDFSSCLRNTYLQSLVEFVVEDRRDWTWEPFVTDFALELLTSPSYLKRSPTMLNRQATQNFSDKEQHTCGVLPNLEAMVFRGGCIWAEDGSVADMVESRWRFHDDHMKKIRRLEIEVMSGNVEDFRRLKEFSCEGLELELLLR